jgi:anti-sigma factor ChrR (cupin superfamily)
MIHLTKASREFVETDLPGVSCCTVYTEAGDSADFLEFKAGATFPLHDHEGPEQILLLSGRIRFGNIELSPGDYLKIGPGEQHDAYALEDSLFFSPHRGNVIVVG